MKTPAHLFLCGLIFFITQRSCWANSDQAIIEKLQQIPIAPEEKQLYAMGADLQKIPCVVLTRKGAFINRSSQPVPYGEVLSILAEFPKEAWPCGRVIYFSPFPLGLSALGDDPPKEEVNRVQAELKAAGIRLLGMNSA